MDVRICLRVRERRDVDLILDSGMLTAGWAADTLNAPGKFLLSAPEHTTPRRARAYHVDDRDVAGIANRHANGRPQLDSLSAAAIAPPAMVDGEPVLVDLNDHAAALWTALLGAGENGSSVKELMTTTGMGRTWVYARL
jgi:S-DNA-T family DNA segregation ATPase FtsK/SpoIIIE